MFMYVVQNGSGKEKCFLSDEPLYEVRERLRGGEKVLGRKRIDLANDKHLQYLLGVQGVQELLVEFFALGRQELEKVESA